MATLTASSDTPYVIVLLVTALAGTVGNSILLAVILRSPSLRNKPAFIIIAALTVSDLFGGAFYASSYAFQVYTTYSRWSNALKTGSDPSRYSYSCKFLALVNEISFMTHSMEMFFLALNRLVVVCFPFWHVTSGHQTFTMRRTIFAISVICGITVGIRIWQFRVGGYGVHLALGACFIDYHNFTTLLFKLHLVWQYLNISLTILCYVLVFMFMKRSNRQHRLIGPNGHIKNTKLILNSSQENRPNSVEFSHLGVSSIFTIAKRSPCPTSSLQNRGYLNNNPTMRIHRSFSVPHDGTFLNNTYLCQVSREAQRVRRRKRSEKDIVMYAFTLSCFYLFVTITFNFSGFRRLHQSSAKLFLFVYSYCFLLIYALNPVISFCFISILREHFEAWRHLVAKK